ncbi:hypothetical protein HII36_35160 [Nonomuraea sp. NN258]|uniref:sensor histidine kinase n=1 Tax=Nonomuraea antri TaxID=2730852 RepID=UPI00156836AB|nr:histidine kinase [Nonomuraea antri]NRQ37040.1 hypothetical protein [Nonomuraea antri]
MALLCRRHVRIPLIVLLVVYLANGPVMLVATRPGLVQAALATVLAVGTLGCCLWALAGHRPSIRTTLLGDPPAPDASFQAADTNSPAANTNSPAADASSRAADAGSPAPGAAKGRNSPALNLWLLLATLAGGSLMHAIAPYSGVAFAFVTVYAAPHRTRLRPALALTTLNLVTLPLISRAIGLDAGAYLGLTAGLAYTAVIAYMMWYLSSTRRQATEVAESRAREAVLSERARLAREIHDILAHSQSAQIVHLEGARLLLKDGGDQRAALDRVERAVRLARAGLEETRRALDALRGDDLPLRERLERLAAEFRAATGASCALSIDPAAVTLPAEARLAVARTAQEALTNVRKHAHGASVAVALRRTGRWCELEVRDNGAQHAIPAPAIVGPGERPEHDGDAHGAHGHGGAGHGVNEHHVNGPSVNGHGTNGRGSTGHGSNGDSTHEQAVHEQSIHENGTHEQGTPENGTYENGTYGYGSGGYGLVGMRERAELIGGSLTAGPQPGGFAVILRVPA